MSQPKRLRRTLLLSALLCLTIAPAALAASDENYTVKCQSDDHFLQIYTAHPIDPGRCMAVVARVLKVYAFVAERAAWKDRAF
jgi:hypothetical protein